MNEKNLKPIRTESEARKKGRNGGIASGKARREKKTIQKILADLLDGQIKDSPQFAKLASKMGVESDKSVKDIFTYICVLNSVKNGNLGDLERLRKLLGEQVEITDSEEQKQIDAHNELIEALKSRRNNED